MHDLLLNLQKIIRQFCDEQTRISFEFVDHGFVCLIVEYGCIEKEHLFQIGELEFFKSEDIILNQIIQMKSECKTFYEEVAK